MIDRTRCYNQRFINAEEKVVKAEAMVEDAIYLCKLVVNGAEVIIIKYLYVSISLTKSRLIQIIDYNDSKQD
jgi:hypothetical protein